MSRLRELHVRCGIQQETLEMQVQVIFEYKERLEKALAKEKSSNAALKQELEQRAKDEKLLSNQYDVIATRRYSALLDINKAQRTEYQYLKEACEKQKKQALDETKRLETTVSDLRSQLREGREDEEKSMDNEKTDNKIEHLRTEVIQPNSELNYTQIPCKMCNVTTLPDLLKKAQEARVIPNPDMVDAGPEDFDTAPEDSYKSSLPLPYLVRSNDKEDDDSNTRKENKVKSIGDAPPKPVLSASKRPETSSPIDAEPDANFRRYFSSGRRSTRSKFKIQRKF